MEISVIEKYLRISQKKVKGIARAISGMPANSALEKLSFTNDKAGRIVGKSLQSILANAKNNNKVDTNSLIIKEIIVLKGPSFKRWQPVSKGMAHQIKKRTTHIKIVLAEKTKEKKNPEVQTEVVEVKESILEKSKVKDQASKKQVIS